MDECIELISEQDASRPLVAKWSARTAALFRGRWKARALALFSIGCAAAALWWVIAHFDARTFRDQMTHLSASWIAAAVLFDLLSYVGQGYRWSVLLDPVAPVNTWRTTRAVYAGLFVNEILPLRPGEILRGVVIARESGSPVTRIVPSMAAERLMDAFWLILAACAASLMVTLPPPIGTFSRIAAIATAAALIVLGLARRYVPVIWLDALHNRYALVLSGAILCSQGLALWSVLRACRLPLSLPAGIVVMLVLRAGTALPGAPANLGTHQLSTMLGLSLFGISQAAASPVAFIVFAVLTIPLWIGGALAMASLGLPVRSVVSGVLPFGRHSWAAGSRILTMEVDN